NRRWYAIAFAFFAAALLSKSVTCSLPAAILLVLWWKRGRITSRDIVLLAPFFIAGVAMAYVTARLEVEHVGAVGRAWDYTFLDRCLIAGRALWFYTGKLFWPAKLTFIYPKWKIDSRDVVQWIYPVA